MAISFLDPPTNGSLSIEECLSIVIDQQAIQLMLF